jgi:hypothetical protein
MTLKKKSKTVKEFVENKAYETIELTIEQKKAALKKEEDLELQSRLSKCHAAIQAALKEFGCIEVANVSFSSMNAQPQITITVAAIVGQ